jgi:hypothetical protein
VDSHHVAPDFSLESGKAAERRFNRGCGRLWKSTIVLADDYRAKARATFDGTVLPAVARGEILKDPRRLTRPCSIGSRRESLPDGLATASWGFRFPSGWGPLLIDCSFPGNALLCHNGLAARQATYSAVKICHRTRSVHWAPAWFDRASTSEKPVLVRNTIGFGLQKDFLRLG